MDRRTWLKWLSLAFALGAGAPAARAAVRPPVPSGQIATIAFGSCVKQWEPQPIWNSIAAAKPDLFLFLGDNIYADWHGGATFTPS